MHCGCCVKNKKIFAQDASDFPSSVQIRKSLGIYFAQCLDTLWVVALLFNSPDKRNCWPEKIWRVIHLLLNDSLVCTASADQIIIICYFLDQLRRRSAALQNGGWNVNTKQYFKLSFGRARSYIILKFPPFQLPWTPWGSWGLPASSARPQPSPRNQAGRQKVRGSQTRPADQWGPWIGDTVRWSCFFLM